MTLPAATAERGIVRPGRPRDPRAERRILAAALQIISEDGYAGLRVSEIAERAGVSKATLYRRWNSKAHLAVAALRSLPDLPAPDAGSLRRDLGAILQAFVQLSETTPLPSVLTARCVEASKDAELALDPLRRDRTRPLFVALQRSMTRGEIPPATDLQFAVGLVTGPVLSRIFLSEEIPADYVEQVVDAVVRALSSMS